MVAISTKISVKNSAESWSQELRLYGLELGINPLFPPHTGTKSLHHNDEHCCYDQHAPTTSCKVFYLPSSSLEIVS